MMRSLFVVSMLSVVLGCQRSNDAPAPAAKAEAQVEAPPASVDLKLEPRADGTIVFSAKDKWGASIETVYENVTFLENAVPTLERALSPEQSAMLKAEVAKLKTGAK